MLSIITLCVAFWAGPTAPTQTAPTDTTRQFRGFANLPFAWGTAVLRKGKVVRAYLPTATTRGLETMVPYYLQAPGPGKLPNPKLLTAANVQWMRVGGQYWEVLRNNRNDEGSLAQRRQAGTVDLFLVQASATLILTALEPNPVLSSPAGATLPEMSPSPASWYLRRAMGPPVLVAQATFATQVAAFLHDDPELARRVATSQLGYRYAELESIIQQYNRRAHR
ncbi:hypothetical protein GCM10022409_23110 [Hymenobacter glaciei]|uniref:Uncharacterized protein n=1 Tax=Hymenobacter glaciei TaxID=877209 RepID=A0ABP7U7M6_9BACT